MAAPIDPYLRKQPWRHRGIDVATGRALCFCGCGQPVGPKRRSSAGRPCVVAWESHSNIGLIVYRVEQRDHGVCAICGVNAERLRRMANPAERMRRLRHWLTHRHGWQAINRMCDAAEQRINDRALAFGRRMTAAGWPSASRKWWEADHIVPVAEGGGGCDHTGYRTLCIRCHRRETAALRRRLSARCLTPCCRLKPEPLDKPGLTDIIAVRCPCGAVLRYDNRRRLYVAA